MKERVNVSRGDALSLGICLAYAAATSGASRGTVNALRSLSFEGIASCVMKTMMSPFVSIAAIFLVFPWLKFSLGMHIVRAPNPAAISKVLSSDDESIMIISNGFASWAWSFDRRVSRFVPAFKVGIMTEIRIEYYCIITVEGREA